MTNDAQGTTTHGEPEKPTRIPVWAWIVGGVLLLAVAGLAIALLRKPAAATDDSWDRVQAAGVLRVATSADYPPFAFENPGFAVDGFDPALIREIASRLGVDAQITDYAFDGLIPALQVEQADVAIAALSVTPDRAALVDFSNVYYVGKDGILAKADSSIDRIVTTAQFAGRTVGVQTRSVYEVWAQQNLVGTGIIAPDQLLVYAKPEHAADDIKHGRLDLAIMDLQPAIHMLVDPELKLVGEGLDQQLLAIAVPKDAEALRAQIDQALLRLQNEGRVTQLVQTYLGIRPEDIIPPPAPQPTAAPCVESMMFVEDLNYDDKGGTEFPVLDPGKSFKKGWRVRNTGTCAWTGAHFIKYVKGNDPAAQMGGHPTAIQGTVEPGQTYDMYVDLVSPAVAGKYVGYWQMHSATGVPYGQTIWVAIEVRETAPGVPTSTPTVEASPTPPVPTEPVPTMPPEPTEQPGSDLLDVSWLLKGYRGEIKDTELVEPIVNVDVILNFDRDGRFSGSTGCNTVSGRYVTDGTGLILKDFLVTQRACEEPPGIMDQELQYLQWLERTEEYRITEDDSRLEFIIYVIEKFKRVEKVVLEYTDLRLVPH